MQTTIVKEYVLQLLDADTDKWFRVGPMTTDKTRLAKFAMGLMLQGEVVKLEDVTDYGTKDYMIDK